VHLLLNDLTCKNGKCLGKRAEGAEEAKLIALIAPGFSQGLKAGVFRLQPLQKKHPLNLG